MLELWLNFTDPDGATRRVRVVGQKFVIGRHSDCDLSIPDGRLSRTHAEIDRAGEIWEISDAGSSNGTEVNGNPVFERVPLADGHRISLGGFPITVEVVAYLPEAVRIEGVASTPAAEPSPAARTSGASRRIPVALIFAPPILALFLVTVGGGVAYLVTAGNRSVAVVTNGDDDPVTEDDPPSSTGSPEDAPSTSVTPTPVPTGPTPTPANLSETEKVEVNGANFLRKIAQNDPNIFLTTEQAKRISSKVKQLSSSSAAIENLKSAKQNGTQITALAAERNLKPQLLAVAAVARLGNSRGDVVATAKTMAEVLDKLAIQVGNELADDCLLMIAAYDQGAAGETMKMRNMLQNLANETNESSRTIRTIWFLEKRGKITSAEFDRALTFLAIGAIAQNPADFGVNAEALNI
ncbi:MAG TPA: FHA domain-containing protein [Pyrinomonadaceae bacterium]